MYDIFNFLWDQSGHMFFSKEKQKLYIIPAGITCSKWAIKVQEKVQGIKYVQSQKERP